MDEPKKELERKCETCGEPFVPGQVAQVTITGLQCLPCWNLQVLDAIRRNQRKET